MTLLPPFIDSERPIALPLNPLIAVILLLQLIYSLIYANDGKVLSQLLTTHDNIRLFNHIAGSLMVIVGLGLALEK